MDTEMTKTTIYLPKQLLRRIKFDAINNNQTLKDFVTEALEEKLGVKKNIKVKKIKFGGYKLGGLI